MSNPTPTLEPTTINASRALRMIQDAVKTRSPDYNYKLDPERFPNDSQTSSCVYARNGQADCLVGVALFLEGVPVTALETIEAESYELESSDEEAEHVCPIEDCEGTADHSTSIADRWVRLRLKQLTGFTLTDEAVDVFSSAQIYQDTARTWGEAEAAAAKTKEQGFREPLPNGAFG